MKTRNLHFFSFNDIGDVGLGEVVQSLLNNNTIKILDVEHNSISSVGAAHLKELLSKNQHIKELKISDNTGKNTIK